MSLLEFHITFSSFTILVTVIIISGRESHHSCFSKSWKDDQDKHNTTRKKSLKKFRWFFFGIEVGSMKNFLVLTTSHFFDSCFKDFPLYLSNLVSITRRKNSTSQRKKYLVVVTVDEMSVAKISCTNTSKQHIRCWMGDWISSSVFSLSEKMSKFFL